MHIYDCRVILESRVHQYSSSCFLGLFENGFRSGRPCCHFSCLYVSLRICSLTDAASLPLASVPLPSPWTLSAPDACAKVDWPGARGVLAARWGSPSLIAWKRRAWPSAPFRCHLCRRRRCGHLCGFVRTPSAASRPLAALSRASRCSYLAGSWSSPTAPVERCSPFGPIPGAAVTARSQRLVACHCGRRPFRGPPPSSNPLLRYAPPPLKVLFRHPGAPSSLLQWSLLWDQRRSCWSDRARCAPLGPGSRIRHLWVTGFPSGEEVHRRLSAWGLLNRPNLECQKLHRTTCVSQLLRLH